MNELLQQEVQDEIQGCIDKGFFNKEETLMRVADMFYDEKLDEDWLKEAIDTTYATRLEEQKEWPAVTDVDKLKQAFEQLEQQDVIALHMAGNSMSDGATDATERYYQMKEEGRQMKGYCFYHEQDIEGAMEELGLYLAFSDIESDPAQTVVIGETVAAIMQQHGFTVVWDGTSKKRILLSPFAWQNRL